MWQLSKQFNRKELLDKAKLIEELFVSAEILSLLQKYLFSGSLMKTKKEDNYQQSCFSLNIQRGFVAGQNNDVQILDQSVEFRFV